MLSCIVAMVIGGSLVESPRPRLLNQRLSIGPLVALMRSEALGNDALRPVMVATPTPATAPSVSRVAEVAGGAAGLLVNDAAMVALDWLIFEKAVESTPGDGSGAGGLVIALFELGAAAVAILGIDALDSLFVPFIDLGGVFAGSRLAHNPEGSLGLGLGAAVLTQLLMVVVGIGVLGLESIFVDTQPAVDSNAVFGVTLIVLGLAHMVGLPLVTSLAFHLRDPESPPTRPTVPTAPAPAPVAPLFTVGAALAPGWSSPGTMFFPIFRTSF